MAATRKKITFKGQSVDAVIRQYKRTRLISYALYSLALLMVMMSLTWYSVDSLTALGLILTVGLAVFAVYVIHNIGIYMMTRYLEILRAD